MYENFFEDDSVTVSIPVVSIPVVQMLPKGRNYETKANNIEQPGNCLPSLTYFHTMPHFDALKIYSSGKHCEKRRNS